MALHRRLRVRTRREISIERAALEALRGDFAAVSRDAEAPAQASEALKAAQT